jgi:hypothetical protein
MNSDLKLPLLLSIVSVSEVSSINMELIFNLSGTVDIYIAAIIEYLRRPSRYALTMEAKIVPETLDVLSVLTRLVSQEQLIVIIKMCMIIFFFISWMSPSLPSKKDRRTQPCSKRAE